MAIDPILAPSNTRFTPKPIKYPKLWQFYKLQLDKFWVVNELDFAPDIPQWKSLSENEQHFLKHVLAFFAASDGIVNENLATRFYDEVQIPEARQFYAVQIAIEAIHGETYAELIETFVNDTDEKNNLFKAIETMPIVKKKAEWALKWIDSNAKFSERLFAFAAVEGIFFSSSFCSIYWLADRGLMTHGLKKSNEFISRDEGIHTDFALALHDHLQPENRIDEKRAHELIREAVEIECEFACEALPVSLIGMNSDYMKQYIKVCADRLLKQAGFSAIYHETMPLAFMEKISLSNKTNFHEGVVSDYTKGVDMTPEEMTMAFSGDISF